MSHYFSHVRLQASLRQDDWLRGLVRHGEPYRDHALIWRLFPGDGMARDFLFRRLEDERSFYVVSARPPQPDSGLFQIRSKPYAPQLEQGAWLRFDLRANPTVSLRQEDGRSRRHDVLMHAKHEASVEQRGQLRQVLDAAGRDWLLTRAERWGLSIRAESVLQNGYRQQRLRRKGRTIEYSSLDYQGLAEVTDPQRLRQALLEGVGHSKGFGCGLLLVRRI
ncbi:type I-E CRISPR-associated protein Cas6/Cse3/CasE [Stutzerimonas stutzeri]|uniref:type I-E CRISPR-associated protein Cas6/Cse3/CasE n=1 Tax=Stutzerimonas stutzeri TaxID=316 RepID=UPI001CFE8A4A|nr:type I-E CRISPR-associated protein Cas6/Cse3/CasE [Stutzerimonas stutzeri]|tara:strand:+ start:6883 stop:7545 length:663 start_codon:yes stop_codon:yes gene_type:complete